MAKFQNNSDGSQNRSVWLSNILIRFAWLQCSNNSVLAPGVGGGGVGVVQTPSPLVQKQTCFQTSEFPCVKIKICREN